MKLFVKVKPLAGRTKVEKIDEEHYVISVREAPENNEANFAVMKALADYFHTPISRVKLLSGKTSRNKIFSL